MDVATRTPSRVLPPGAGRPTFGYGGDFGPKDTPSDEAFCINGLVSPFTSCPSRPLR